MRPSVNHLEMDNQNNVEYQSVPEVGLLNSEGQSNPSRTFSQALGQQMFIKDLFPSLCQALCYNSYIM